MKSRAKLAPFCTKIPMHAGSYRSKESFPLSAVPSAANRKTPNYKSSCTTKIHARQQIREVVKPCLIFTCYVPWRICFWIPFHMAVFPLGGQRLWVFYLMVRSRARRRSLPGPAQSRRPLHYAGLSSLPNHVLIVRTFSGLVMP